MQKAVEKNKYRGKQGSLAVLTKDEQILSSCCQGDSSEPQFGGKDQSCFVALHIKYAQEGMRVNHASLQES